MARGSAARCSARSAWRCTTSSATRSAAASTCRMPRSHTIVLPHALGLQRARPRPRRWRASRGRSGASDAAPRPLRSRARRSARRLALRDIGMPADGLDRAADLATTNPYSTRGRSTRARFARCCSVPTRAGDRPDVIAAGNDRPRQMLMKPTRPALRRAAASSGPAPLAATPALSAAALAGRRQHQDRLRLAADRAARAVRRSRQVRHRAA